VSRALRAVLAPFLVSRLALVLVGVLSLHLLPSALQVQKGNLVYHRPGPSPLEIWARWDSEWYLLIAERGYGADDAFLGLPVAYRRGDDAGFFPLYPMLVRGVAALGPSTLLAGVLVSNLALLIALALLREMTRRDHGEMIAGRAVWIVLAFPTSFFLSAVYAESLLLATLLGSIALARAGRPLLAGTCAALCALSKPTGLLVLVPLVIELWPDRTAQASTARTIGTRALRLTTAIVPVAAALGGWALACQALYGDVAPFLARQARWRGPTSGPWRAFVRYFDAPRVHDAHHSTIDLVCAILFVAALPAIWRRLRTSEAAWATVAMLLPLSSSLWSFTRFAASIAPFHVSVALSTESSERRFTSFVVAMLPLGGLFMALFAAWWWVG
jgi:hypothetical protein